MAKDHIVNNKEEASPESSKTPWHVVDASRTVGSVAVLCVF
jgi:hypothetical protein